MEMLTKAAALALTAAVMGLVLKKSAPELGFVLSLAAAAAVLAAAARLGQNLSAALSAAQQVSALDESVVQPVIKCIGIGIITRLAADLCADAGQSAAAAAVETCGAVCALSAALPLMESFFAMIDEML